MKRYTMHTLLMLLGVEAISLVDPSFAGFLGMLLMFRVSVIALTAIGFPIHILLNTIHARS
jgi:hypothetical protein